MIDPACGSGHFLLGGFRAIVAGVATICSGSAARRASAAGLGCDRRCGPQSVCCRDRAISAAAGRAASGGCATTYGGTSFRMHLASGDSLLHGRHFFRRELGGTDEGFRRALRHHYAAEDTAEIDHILGRQYHAVVGNPPYITPKDPAMRDAYREIYASCHLNTVWSAIYRAVLRSGTDRRRQASGGICWFDCREQLHEEESLARS